jgi:biotin carboxylase
MGRHILIINRFDNESGRYHQSIDHEAHAVSYITSAAGARPLDHEAAEAVIVADDLGDWAAVERHARQLASQFGPFDLLLALSEYDLELGAALREQLGVPGPGPEDIRRVRDKVVMKELVAAAGLRVPRFIVAESAARVREFAAAIGFPLVLKPRDRWDNQGLYVVRTPAALEQVLAQQPLDDYECEEFIDGRMYHVDGLAQDGHVRVMRSSRLLVPCLDFALGNPFGSLSNDDPALEDSLRRYAQTVVTALGMGTSAFHLEVFRTADPVPDGAPEHANLVFVEVGGRVGGAQIPFIWREVYGVDLVATWVRMLLGETPDLPDVSVSGEAGGYLMMPEPRVRPCRVLAVAAQLDVIPEMYAEILPAPGAILDGTGGSRETAGNFRYRAASSAAIETAIQATIAGYHLDWERLAADGLPEAGQAPRPAGRVQAVVVS